MFLMEIKDVESAMTAFCNCVITCLYKSYDQPGMTSVRNSTVFIFLFVVVCFNNISYLFADENFLNH